MYIDDKKYKVHSKLQKSTGQHWSPFL